MRWLFVRNFGLRRFLKLIKLSVFLLLVSMHLAVADVGAQAKITIGAGTVTYWELFNQIKKQTGLTVVLRNNELDKHRTVEAGFIESDLRTVLDKILTGTRLTYEIMDEFIVLKVVPEEKKNETAVEKAKREHKLKSLNALCVRLVFCLYAEDAGIFGEKRNMFHDYLARYEARDCRRALIELFKVLDTEDDDREDYLEEDLAQFPYVNGGLFADETIEIPQFTEEIRELLLVKASEEFNWRDISPTIFGAVFESTLNPETRRSGGMHYTSIENIHKVIDPLFLNNLEEEFNTLQAYKTLDIKRKHLMDFQEKLAHLKFLDPACGSGNFLTETYLSLRRLENKVLRVLYGEGQGVLGIAASDIIKVSIQQFYGIEINDFAVTVAKTALWIAESQMLDETKNIIYGLNADFLPLKTYVNITEGNALRMDWNSVIPANSLSYIMGNPPFLGYALQSQSQKDDIKYIASNIDCKIGSNVDYVAMWYFKASEYIKNTEIKWP